MKNFTLIEWLVGGTVVLLVLGLLLYVVDRVGIEEMEDVVMVIDKRYEAPYTTTTYTSTGTNGVMIPSTTHH